MVQSIVAEGLKPGVAVNPETPADALEPLLPYVDNICLMGIAPGFAGQQMLEYTFTKVAAVRSRIAQCGSAATITVDGGVKASNAARLVQAGADILVLSSGIYQHPKPETSLEEVRRAVGQ
jgi:ribulose-phosphate 3-epimerase